MREQLACQPFSARVLAVFDRVCDLVTPEGKVIALVTPDVGDGPLNIVVGAWSPTWFCHFGPNLQIDDMQIDLSQATVWEPRPDWSALRDRLDPITGRLPALYEMARRHVQVAWAGTSPTPIQITLPKPMPEGWNGDLDKLRNGAAQLAGLGRGLTPAGDDFLCGVMLWAWLAHPAPDEFCRAIAETATPRTTTLSAAFLRSAARGECPAAWHQLLAALASGSEQALDAATRQVLAHGATSGADMLAGFLALTPAPALPL